jgi:hypothetical protein
MSDSPATEVATCSIIEAGKILGIGREASYEAARTGLIPVLWFGRKGRVPIAALYRRLEQAGEQPQKQEAA